MADAAEGTTGKALVIEINASTKGPNDEKREFKTSIEVEATEEAFKARFGPECDVLKETADNVGRRIANGVRAMIRDAENMPTKKEVEEYIANWKVGARSEAAPVNKLKNALKDADPEKKDRIMAALLKLAEKEGL